MVGLIVFALGFMWAWFGGDPITCAAQMVCSVQGATAHTLASLAFWMYSRGGDAFYLIAGLALEIGALYFVWVYICATFPKLIK